MEQNVSTTNSTNTSEYWVLVWIEHSGHTIWGYYNDPTVSDFTVFVLILVLCTALFLMSFWWRAPVVYLRSASQRPADPQKMPLISFPQ